MAPMAGHRPIAFRKRRPTALPYSSRPRYRSSRSTLSVPAGSGPTWAAPTPPAQSPKARLALSGSRPTLLKTRPASFGGIERSFPGDSLTSYFVLLNSYFDDMGANKAKDIGQLG